MGLRADSARSQRVSGSARTDSQRAESARNPIAANVKFGDDSALSAFTRTQWTAALRVIMVGDERAGEGTMHTFGATLGTGTNVFFETTKM